VQHNAMRHAGGMTQASPGDDGMHREAMTLRVTLGATTLRVPG
jgi:hypothetical protein